MRVIKAKDYLLTCRKSSNLITVEHALPGILINPANQEFSNDWIAEEVFSVDSCDLFFIQPCSIVGPEEWHFSHRQRYGIRAGLDLLERKC